MPKISLMSSLPNTTKPEPSEDFLDYIDALEKGWRESLRAALPITESGWLEIFPDAKAIIPLKIAEWAAAAEMARVQVRAVLATINGSEAERSFWRSVLKHTNPSVRELALARRRINSLRLLLPSTNKRGLLKWNSAYLNAKGRDLLEVARHYALKLQKAGRTYRALCPAHSERTPSFHIYHPSRFVCFGCGIKGSVIDFVSLMENCSFKEAVYKLQNI